MAISYLIVIGDLMPQVVQGFDSNLDRFDFMLDRHFWITVFMSDPTLSACFLLIADLLIGL